MGRRTLLLIASVLLAAVGTAIVALYVRQADDRATEHEAVRSYVVAAREIPADTKITESDLATRQLRVRDQISSTMTNSDLVIRRRAKTDILANTPIDQRELIEAGADLDTGAIRKGELGIDVQLEDPQRAASLLGIGSSVRIFTLQGKAVKPLVDRARVITIGSTQDAAGADGPDGRHKVVSSGLASTVVGLSVAPDIAQKLIDTQVKQQPMYFAVIPGIEVTDS